MFEEATARSRLAALTSRISGWGVALADFTGRYGDYQFERFGTVIDVDVSMQGEQVQIRKAEGKLTSGTNPGGTFSVRRDDGSETTHPKIVGEVVYRGPNVMMGYAQDESGLAAGDEYGGVLATGDLGYLDEEGYLFITGRLKRIGKVFGNRVSLDDLEQAVRVAAVGVDVVAAVSAGDKVVLFAEGADGEICQDAARALSERLHLHTSGFDVRPIDAVPLLASGKIDYRSLEARV